MNAHVSRNALLIIISVVTCFLANCSKKAPTGDSSHDPVGAKPFRGEVYRKLDNSKSITLTSPDELELSENGINLICKYSKQGDTLRIVANVAGTTQAIYYRITDEGLQGNDGTTLLAPQPLALALEKERLDKQRREEERQRIAKAAEEWRIKQEEERRLTAKEHAQSRIQTAEVAKINLAAFGILIATEHYSLYSSPFQAIVTDVSVKLYWRKEDARVGGQDVMEVFYFDDLLFVGNGDEQIGKADGTKMPSIEIGAKTQDRFKPVTSCDASFATNDEAQILIRTMISIPWINAFLAAERSALKSIQIASNRR